MAKAKVKGAGTKQSPWQLTTPSGSSENTMYKDESLEPPAIACSWYRSSVLPMMYMPPLLEALGLAEVEHKPKNNRMHAN